MKMLRAKLTAPAVTPLPVSVRRVPVCPRLRGPRARPQRLTCCLNRTETQAERVGERLTAADPQQGSKVGLLAGAVTGRQGQSAATGTQEVAAAARHDRK